MGKRLILALAVIVLLTTPVSASTATADGSRASAFRAEIKAKHIKLRKYSCAGTVLYADTKLPAKRIKQVRKWIGQLPKKVQKKAKRVYFVRKKYYMLTGKGLKPTSGYTIFPQREIWFYNVKDSDELMDTVFHEFGHCWDYDGKRFKLSNSSAWENVMVNYFAAVTESEEYYAAVFAEYFAFINDPDFSYIHKSLGYK